MAFPSLKRLVCAVLAAGGLVLGTTSWAEAGWNPGRFPQPSFNPPRIPQPRFPPPKPLPVTGSGGYVKQWGTTKGFFPDGMPKQPFGPHRPAKPNVTEKKGNGPGFIRVPRLPF